MLCIPYGVAFLLAFYISLHDFFGANPAIYFAFAKKSWWLWAYAVIFGAIAMLFLLLIQREFLDASLEKSDGTALEVSYSIWMYSLFAGVSTKPLLNISIYNVPLDGRTFPIGVATFLQLFEPHLKKQIDDDHFIHLDKFLKTAVSLNATLSLSDIRQITRTTSASRLSQHDVSSFELELSNAGSPREAFNLYLTKFGKKIFCHTFTCPQGLKHSGDAL
jgi:hypothetical protein